MSPHSKSSTELKTRTVPMRVLVLGFCRTGTSSMRDALRMLGYNDTHHMDSVFRDPSQIGPWTAAIHDKFFGKGKPYGRAEWDSLLGDCQAVTDLPSILFAEDLIEAYPEAKVVLTLRDPDAWYISYDRTIGSILRSRTSYIAGALNPGFLGKFFPFARACSAALLGKDSRAALLGKEETSKDVAKARFVAHYDRVRSLVPPERLLEYRVSEGVATAVRVSWGRSDVVWTVYRGVALKFVLPALLLGVAIYWQTHR
ncbi:hypothetical protein MVEN_00918600 [Mycena venus]|uniref:NAD dependent epimerase/dehydratase n=1 Tax=Mycena venus TaxID=2733690 RepID=A0A8H6YCF4_9AGAR|nr:hypothetical protein MVEN_00918600 [Mycena venus]